MKFKLAKKYSLILTCVMFFNLFVPIIAGAKGVNLKVSNHPGGEGSCNMDCCELPDDCNLISENLNEKEDIAVDQSGDNRESTNLKETVSCLHESWLNFKIDVNNLKFGKVCVDDDMVDNEYSTTYSQSAHDEGNGKYENINNEDSKKNEDNVYDNKNCSQKNINKRDYVIRFCLNIGNDADIYNQQIVKEGDLVKRIADPERAEYIFGGWYDNKNCNGNSYNFNDPVLRDFTLYAKWIKREQLPKTKLLKNGIPFIGKNDITKLFRINKNVSSHLKTYPVKPRNSIARFRRLGNIHSKNANEKFKKNDIFKLLSENIGVFNNLKMKKDVRVKDERRFSNDLYLRNPETGDMGIIIWVGIIVVSALGTAGVVKLLKKEK